MEYALKGLFSGTTEPQKKEVSILVMMDYALKVKEATVKAHKRTMFQSLL